MYSLHDSENLGKDHNKHKSGPKWFSNFLIFTRAKSKNANILIPKHTDSMVASLSQIWAKKRVIKQYYQYISGRNESPSLDHGSIRVNLSFGTITPS